VQDFKGNIEPITQPNLRKKPRKLVNLNVEGLLLVDNQTSFEIYATVLSWPRAPIGRRCRIAVIGWQASFSRGCLGRISSTVTAFGVLAQPVTSGQVSHMFYTDARFSVADSTFEIT
jgi:hypothetical protein